MPMGNQIIPVMHCFNNKYFIAACVAFYSMLKNADPAYQYRMYVLHTDITELNQKRLSEIVNHFPNAAIEFINMDNKFSELFRNTKAKGHFSKEIYYKFLAPEIFKQYDKMIITDVDVCYNGDIAKDYSNIENFDDYYIAGVKTLRPSSDITADWLQNFRNTAYAHFTEEEKQKLVIGAGYMVFNLKKMREDNITEKLINFAKENCRKLIQPEQDVLNLICFPKITYLHARNMVCTYLYDIYNTEATYEKDERYSKEETKETLEKPVQIHYARRTKPWNGITPKNGIWTKYLISLSEEIFNKNIDETLISPFTEFMNGFFKYRKIKKLFSFYLPFLPYRFTLTKERIKEKRR